MRDQIEARFNLRLRTEATKRRKVLQIAKELSTTLGTDFFQSLVRHLAATLDMDYVYLTELAGISVGRMRSLAVFRKGEKAENFLQDLDGTAFGHVLAAGAFACGKDAMLLFPLDKLLESVQAESFVGVRLSDSFGQPVGLLALVSTERLADVSLVKSVLETFVPRTAAEVERKRSDAIHKENDERHRAFIASNPDGMWRFEFDQPIPLSLAEEEQIDRIYRFGYVAECNDAMARMAGALDTELLVGARFGEIVSKTDGRLLEELRSAIRERFRASTVETIILDESGRRLHRLRTQFGIVENGELQRIWGTTRDITELRQAELSLASSEQRFRDVLENIHLPAFMLDRNGAITFYNECFARMTQRSAEELCGKTWLEGIVPAEESQIWRAALLPAPPGKGVSSHFEGVIVPHDGQQLLIAWDIVRFGSKDDEQAGLAAIGRDLTRQLSLEAVKRQAQKLDSIGRFAKGIAHDFNNLLTVILGESQELLKHLSDADPTQARLSGIRIADAATQCSNLTAQLLTIGREQDLRSNRVSLNDVIAASESVIRGLIHESIELTINLESSLAPVRADPAQIQRVLINLVTNARDAMPKGGKLIIATSNVGIGEDSHSYPPGVKPGVYVILSVTDTGVGMTEEIKANIFEPFFTTKAANKGLGLGLSLAYGIVAQSGGQLVVRSEPEKGATFEVLLPVMALEAQALKPRGS